MFLRLDAEASELLRQVQPALAYRRGYFGGANRTHVLNIALAFAQANPTSLAPFARKIDLSTATRMHYDLRGAIPNAPAETIAEAAVAALGYYTKDGIPSAQGLEKRRVEHVWYGRSQLPGIALAAFAGRRATAVEIARAGEERMRAWLKQMGPERALRDDLVEVEARFDPVVFSTFKEQAEKRRLDWETLLRAPG